MDRRILFYDGACPMCNHMVLWLLKREVKNEVFFAPLEGITAQKVLGKDYEELIEMDTVVFAEGPEVYVRSDAAIQAILHTKYYSWLGWIIKLFPSRLRDMVYVWISKHRRQLWKTCPLIPGEYRARFLD